MLIDWFTVGAQALNFLILVWLMKRFLYVPILNAIDEREKKVAAELADAHAKKAEAKKEQDEFLKKNEEFDAHHSALLAKVAKEAKEEKKRLLDEARQVADDLRTKRNEGLASEFQSLSQELTRRTRDEVFQIARKALTDLASTTLEEQMVEVLVRRLRDQSDSEKDALKAAFNASPSALTVSSAFTLAVAQQTTIGNTVKELISDKAALHFKTGPDLVSGIELSANGWSLAWSIEDYLGSLEKGVEEMLISPEKAGAAKA